MEKIDLKKARELTQILSGKKKPYNRYANKLAAIRHKMNADPGLEDRSCLFFFKSKFYHVQGKLKKIAEANVKNLLEQHPNTEVYYLCSDRICPMPDALSGKTKKAIKVKDDQGAADFMSEKSGVTITKNDL